MKTHRLSPIHDLLQSVNGSWRDVNGMSSLVATPDEGSIAAHLGIADVSCLIRFGIKGTNAADWLLGQGIITPDRPNTWNSLPDGSIIARLGMTEFLLEDNLHSQLAPRLMEACQQTPSRVYPVLRQDAAIVLCGAEINELLLQTCSVNFRALSLLERPVILTSVVGVAVTIIPGDRNGQPCYRLWCDSTFGAYLWRTLGAIVAELGGGVIGIEEVMKDKSFELQEKDKR